jgi:SAM-dependent methyltransferase
MDAKINIISPRFRYTGRSHVALTATQTKARDSIRRKLIEGEYRLRSYPCLCGSNDRVSISETDRYGLPLETVVCAQCGMPRLEPRLDDESLREFYKKEYRDLYMESLKVLDGYFRNMVMRGKGILHLIKRSAGLRSLNGLDVLEIGCSAGGILVPFLEEGARVKGYDYDHRYLSYGNTFNRNLNLCFGGMNEIGKDGRLFDVVVINHVLEHFSDPAEAITKIRGILKKDGLIYVGVPGLRNPYYYHSPVKSFLGAMHIGHLYHFSPQLLLRLMKGFQALHLDGEIKGVFRLKESSRNSTFTAEPGSEYKKTMDFILRYEVHPFGKLIRFGIVSLYRLRGWL